jgi:hypothetical protein
VFILEGDYQTKRLLVGVKEWFNIKGVRKKTSVLAK